MDAVRHLVLVTNDRGDFDAYGPFDSEEQAEAYRDSLPGPFGIKAQRYVNLARLHDPVEAMA